MSSLRLFGTPIENTNAAARGDARAASSKSNSQKGSDVSNKSIRNENRVPGPEPPVARFVQRRRLSGVIAQPSLFALQDIEEESSRGDEQDQRVSNSQDGEASISIREHSQSFDNASLNHVIYSTTSSFTSNSSLESTSTTSEPTTPLSSDISTLFEGVDPVPICISSEHEKTAVINSLDWFREETDEPVADSNTLSMSPICWDGSQLSLSRVQKPDRCGESTEPSSKSEGTRRRTYPQLIKRKPVPTRPLKDISREAMMARLVETRPVTSSLLSFTEFTSPSVRRRIHPERAFRSRYASPASDSLRRRSIEQLRLLRSGVSPGILPPPFIKPETFPRAGDLRNLHSPESNFNAFRDDWNLGYVDISFIQKTLFAFDMRMRLVSDRWEDEEFYREFGDAGGWERNWDTRWKIASFLLNQCDDEDEEEDDEEEELKEEEEEEDDLLTL